MSHYDAIVIGAGFAGCVTARQLAEGGNMRVLLLEQRPHIGGNAHDCNDSSGVFVHLYGPHIFHTNDKQVFDYLSRFTQWRDYAHKVVANVNGNLLPVPFNLHSLRLVYGPEVGARLEEKLLRSYGTERKVTILELRQTDDPELSDLAQYIYENIFLHYTTKQWGYAPEDIDPNTIARVPVFLSQDDRYFQDEYQGIPAEGYTRMLELMIDHPGIDVQVNTPADTRVTLDATGLRLDGSAFSGPVVYTGALDELFHCEKGRLPYRTLDFQFETHAMAQYQSHGTVNYTVSEAFTRITEFKHLTGQEKDCTTTVKEFPRAYTGENGEVPYYPVISPQSRALYDAYLAQAAQYPNLHLLGRLAEYQYYNMDAITARALSVAEGLLAR